MEVITLKSSVNWCKHELRSLKSLKPELHPTEKVFKFITPHKYEIVRSEKTNLPIGISFTYGPTLYVGQVNEQIGIPLKEICLGWDSEAEDFTALIFDYDLPCNEETGTV